MTDINKIKSFEEQIAEITKNASRVKEAADRRRYGNFVLYSSFYLLYSQQVIASLLLEILKTLSEPPTEQPPNLHRNA